MDKTKLKLKNIEFHPPTDETEPTIIWTETELSRYKGRFRESIAIHIVFTDTSLSVDEIEKQAIQRAKEFIKDVASTIE